MLIKDFKQHTRRKNTSCIVFCNSVKSARAIEFALAESHVRTACMHGDIPPRLRQANYNKFLARDADVLVATDLASRGLDLPFVSHIVNFDFPKTVSDYLHRAGRAGRAGRQGWVYSLYRYEDNHVIA